MKSPADMRIIQIDITNACPKRCSNCTRFCGHHTEPFFMDFETFKKAVDSLKGFKGIVGIMGGEPTIHPEFEKFMMYYRDHVGYDDPSTALREPTSDFMRHLLGNCYNDLWHNQRGLFTSVTPQYYKHFEIIQDVFGYQLVNDHTRETTHQALMVTRKELGIPDEQWYEMRDKCWIQNLWSASITPKGAFFCEMAASMDATLGGPGGWPIEPGWWKRTPEEFGDQLNWCEMCAACLPMPYRSDQEETDDVSPVWHEKLVQIGSPKLNKGLVQTFEPKEYDPAKGRLNLDDRTPYIENQETRLHGALENLHPQKVMGVLWIDRLGDADSARLAGELAAASRLDCIVSANPSHRALAETHRVKFVSSANRNGRQVYEDVKKELEARDWILLMRDEKAPADFYGMLDKIVFNPGCVYQRYTGRNGGFQFFNVRALSLRQGGDLFDITSAYPRRKILRVANTEPSKYGMSMLRVNWRRAMKRVHWVAARLSGRAKGRTGSQPQDEASAAVATQA